MNMEQKYREAMFEMSTDILLFNHNLNLEQARDPFIHEKVAREALGAMGVWILIKAG